MSIGDFLDHGISDDVGVALLAEECRAGIAERTKNLLSGPFFKVKLASISFRKFLLTKTNCLFGLKWPMRKPIRSLTFLGNRLVENKKNLPVCSDGDIVLLAKVAQFLLLEVGVKLDLKVHSFFFFLESVDFFTWLTAGLILAFSRTRSICLWLKLETPIDLNLKFEFLEIYHLDRLFYLKKLCTIWRLRDF